MSVSTTQLVVEHKGRSYSGIFSVSGTTMIGRIPGIGSTSRAVPAVASIEEYRNNARELFAEMLSSVESERPPMDA